MEVQVDHAAVVTAYCATTTRFLDESPPNALFTPGDSLTDAAPALPSMVGEAPIVDGQTVMSALPDVLLSGRDAGRATGLRNVWAGRLTHEHMFPSTSDVSAPGEIRTRVASLKRRAL